MTTNEIEMLINKAFPTAIQVDCIRPNMTIFVTHPTWGIVEYRVLSSPYFKFNGNRPIDTLNLWIDVKSPNKNRNDKQYMSKSLIDMGISKFNFYYKAFGTIDECVAYNAIVSQYSKFQEDMARNDEQMEEVCCSAYAYY